MSHTSATKVSIRLFIFSPLPLQETCIYKVNTKTLLPVGQWTNEYVVGGWVAGEGGQMLKIKLRFIVEEFFIYFFSFFFNVIMILFLQRKPRHSFGFALLSRYYENNNELQKWFSQKNLTVLLPKRIRRVISGIIALYRLIKRFTKKFKKQKLKT